MSRSGRQPYPSLAWVKSQVSGAAGIGTFDYVIIDDTGGSGDYEAYDSDGVKQVNNVKAELVLEGCLSAGQANTVIYVRDVIDFDDDDSIVTITYPRVSILYGTAASEGTNPFIQKLILDSTSRDVRSCVFEGLDFNEIRLDSTGGTSRIRYNYWNRCYVVGTSTANKQGVVIAGS